jgi:hypothetical protein
VLWTAFKMRFALAVVVIVTANTAAHAVSPREDFLAWYRQWLDQLPLTYEQSFHQVFNHPPEAPLKMASSNWEDADFQLITTTNSSVHKTFRFLANPSYCATVDGLVGSDGDIVWSISQFANRGDGNFEQAAEYRNHMGADPDFLGMRHGRLDGPHHVSAPTRDPGRPGISNVVITFLARDSKKPRLPLRMTVALDDSNHELPVEIRTREIGGAVSRLNVGGWHRQGAAWVFSDLRMFYQRAGAPREVLHSTQSWQFGWNSARRDKECYLSHYGLSEPNQGSWPWRIVALVCALVLLAGGHVMRNQNMEK